jgi:hypothetical protein
LATILEKKLFQIYLSECEIPDLYNPSRILVSPDTDYDELSFQNNQINQRLSAPIVNKDVKMLEHARSHFLPNLKYELGGNFNNPYHCIADLIKILASPNNGMITSDKVITMFEDVQNSLEAAINATPYTVKVKRPPAEAGGFEQLIRC